MRPLPLPTSERSSRVSPSQVLKGGTAKTTILESFKNLVGLGGNKVSVEEAARALMFNESQKRLLKKAVDLGDEASAEELASSLKLGWYDTVSVDLFDKVTPCAGQKRTKADQMVALTKILGAANPLLSNASGLLTSLTTAVDKISRNMIVKSQSQPLLTGLQATNETTDVEAFVHSDDEELAPRATRSSTPIPGTRVWKKGMGRI